MRMNTRRPDGEFLIANIAEGTRPRIGNGTYHVVQYGCRFMPFKETVIWRSVTKTGGFVFALGNFQNITVFNGG
ncbi:Uncharacterised protein [Shigella sonnei]|nr:Uncharacterised protein [Shigella sonnei]CSS71821.1 Uncharacterised protein [Shigella sonnei]